MTEDLTPMINDAEPMDVKTLVEHDRLLDAVEQATHLPEGHPDRAFVEEHSQHLASPEAYRNYYRTMRGESCPEEHIFRRHEQVKRFSVIRQRILDRGHKTVLDLGCLDGWQLLNLAAMGVKGVGVDLCPEALAVGRERAKKWGFPLVFFESPIEGFRIDLCVPFGSDLPSRFEAVILSEVLEHVLDPAACFETAAKHLAPGGIVYVSVPATPIPHHGKIEDAREHLRIYAEDDLIVLAKQAGLARVVDHELLEEHDEGQAFANRTISFRRAEITVYCNHVTGGWSPERMDELSGSEEMVVKAAEAWARAGHAVAVHQNGYDGVVNGVAYLPRSIAPDPNRDLLVLFKTMDYADRPAGRMVFWTTDLPTEGTSAAFLPPAQADRLDAVLCISEYHRTGLLKACPWLDPAKVKAHWLGVDGPEILLAMEASPKVPGRVLYASSYDRGLGFLLEQWPKIRKQVPHAELHVTYGFDFWKRSEAVVPAPVAEGMRQERVRLENLMVQPGVVHKRRLPRGEFLKELAEAQVWAYPCTGGELCCKTALEAQFAGSFPVVVPTMALAETVQWGIKVSPDGFADGVIRALSLESGVDRGPQTIPSWNDLAAWVWGVSGAGEVCRQPVKAGLVIEEPAPAATVVVVPEQFAIPSRVAAPATGLDLLFMVNGMPFDGNTDREKSLGGSETAAVQLGRELQRRGHRVTIFSNLPGPPGKFDGVSYMPIQEWGRYAGSTSHDVSIVQRDPSPMNMPLASKLNVVWCHDLGLLRHRLRFRASLWNVDYLAPVSHWHGSQLKLVYDLPSAAIVPMRNGIELTAIQRSLDHKVPRDKKALVFTARPERGLDLLLQTVFPRLLERDPKLTLYIAGYDNTVESMRDFYAHCQQLIANLGQRAKWMGHLKKAELYALYSRARLYCYVTRGFSEVSCITAMEAAACGLPFVGTTLGALPETTSRVDGFARLVEHTGQADEAFISRFVEAAWAVLNDDLLNKRMSEAGRAGADAYSWVEVAKEWEDFLIGSLETRSASKVRLARHWWRLGDLRGVELALKHNGEEVLIRDLAAKLDGVGDDEPPVPLQHVVNAMAQVAADVKPKTILGIGPQMTEPARTIAGLLGAQAVTEPPADFVFGVETLDCAADPSRHIHEAEALASPGGTICFAIAGPGTHQHRLHQAVMANHRRIGERRRRWVFDNHDIRDLLGKKSDLLAMVVGGGGVSEYDGLPTAWSLFRFRANGGPTGELDLARRLWLQAPRLSLSGCLIVRDAEDMLHRCIKSILPYCDEVLVDDNGSTDSTQDLLALYGITPARGPSPIDVGFDEARNVNIARATGDVVLWIDADEALLDGHQLPKYLRPNLFNGYGVAQHHFSAVPPNAFKPDLPVRLFRRLHVDGTPTGIRFFGKVHEHPEIGINQSVGQSIVVSDVHIAHDGYLTETGRRKRFERNIPLMMRDRAAYPDRLLGKFLMIRDWVHLARYELERSGRRMTPQAAAYLESAVSAYQKDFLGRTHMMAMDGLAYYNEALQHLGRGFETQAVLKIGGLDGMSHDFAYSGRVASQADLQTMLGGASRDLTEVWKGEYV